MISREATFLASRRELAGLRLGHMVPPRALPMAHDQAGCQGFALVALNVVVRLHAIEDIEPGVNDEAIATEPGGHGYSRQRTLKSVMWPSRQSTGDQL